MDANLASVQGLDFRQNLIDAIVLLLLSAAGPDAAGNFLAASQKSRTEVCSPAAMLNGHVT